MPSRSDGVLAAALLLVLTACGGKIATEGTSSGGGGSSSSGASGSSGASSSGSSSGASGTSGSDPGYPIPEPFPGTSGASGTSGGRPAANCPPIPPTEGLSCSWDYGLPCFYSYPTRVNICSVQCTCFGGPGDVNHWTCFEVPCDPR